MINQKTMTAAEYRSTTGKNLSERQIQKAILAYLWGHGFPAFHVPNHGKYDPKTKRYWIVDKEEHIAGVPDIVCPLHCGKVLFLEVKSQSGKLSMMQAAYHAKLRMMGHRVSVVHSVEEVRQCLAP